MANNVLSEWKAFSNTQAYKDLIEYSHYTIDQFMEYAKEGVMPSPSNNGEQVVIDDKKAISLLQKARGCDIILSYIEEQTSYAK